MLFQGRSFAVGAWLEVDLCFINDKNMISHMTAVHLDDSIGFVQGSCAVDAHCL